MRVDTRTRMIGDAMARYRAGRINRRQLMGLLGALGVSAASVPFFLRDAGAKTAPGGGDHSGHGPAILQEGTPGPEGEEPPPQPTPQLGEQSDGTTRWKVVAGGFSEELGAEFNAFLPETITINAGDSIYFEIGGFHTVTLLAGSEPRPILIADPSGAPPVATPPASAADQPQLIFNPEVFLPAGDGTVDGSAYVNSGLPLDPSAPPIVWTFPTAGTFDIICLVHPEYMKGQVVVQEAGSAAPMDQAAIDQAVADEIAQLTEQTQALLDSMQATPATGDGAATHEVIVGPGEDQIDTFRFVPNELNIKAGDTVRWVTRASMTPHTVTFLGGTEPPEDVIIQPSDAGPPTIIQSPVTFFPSDAPAAYNGQGFVNSGWLAGEHVQGLLGIEYDPPDSFELTFDTEGEHKYYCILHASGPDDPPTEGMTGKIIVSAAG